MKEFFSSKRWIVYQQDEFFYFEDQFESDDSFRIFVKLTIYVDPLSKKEVIGVVEIEDFDLIDDIDPFLGLISRVFQSKNKHCLIILK